MSNYQEIESSQRQQNELMRREQELCDMHEFHALRVAKELCGTSKKDGNQWCFLYGENLQEGVAGFGNSIIQSALNFLEELRKTMPDGWERI